MFHVVRLGELVGGVPQPPGPTQNPLSSTNNHLASLLTQFLSFLKLIPGSQEGSELQETLYSPKIGTEASDTC